MARKIIFSIIGVLFLLFAYFQWNDPDSMLWIIYYTLIAGLSFGTAFRRNRLLYIYVMMGFTIIWLLTLFPEAIQWVKDGMPSIVESMKASSPYIELVREFLGLGISLVAILAIFMVERKPTRS